VTAGLLAFRVAAFIAFVACQQLPSDLCHRGADLALV